MTPWNWSTTWRPSQAPNLQKLYPERIRGRDADDETVGSKKRVKVDEHEVDEADDEKAETVEDTIPVESNPGVREEEFLQMWGPNALMGQQEKILRVLWNQLTERRQDQVLKTKKLEK